MNFRLRRLVQSLAAASALGLSFGTANAVLVDGIEVGSVDTILDSYSSANSGDAAEIAALEAACTCTISLVTKVDSPTVMGPTNDTYAIDVSPDTPGFYLLKFGNGTNTNTDTIVFQNLDLLTFLVWTGAGVAGEGILDNHLASISHYTYGSGGGGGGGGGGGPEPASLALVGLALAAAGVAGKRKQSRG